MSNKYDEELVKPLVSNHIDILNIAGLYDPISNYFFFFQVCFFLVGQGFQSLWLKLVQKISNNSYF